MNIFIPFIVLSVLSYSLSIFYKISISKSYLLISFIIILSLLIFGKFNLLEEINYFISFSSIPLLIYLISKKRINSNYIKNIIILFSIYSILIFFGKDLFLYKYDEFSEYGITSKLIFSENALPFNIDYLQKGSHHKINLISYFHYFFLKNSNNLYLESTTLIAHSFLIVLIMNFILDFIKINFFKKIIIIFSIYFLIYTLGPGFDRLYVDSILGLLIGSILVLHFEGKKNKSDQILFFLLILVIPMIKPNGLIIILGLIPIIFLNSFYSKSFKQFVLIIFALFINFLVSELYTSNINQINFLTFQKDILTKDILTKEKSYNTDPGATFTIKTLNRINNEFVGFENIKKNKVKFFKTHFTEITNNGIYHAKTFLILNKILSYINIDFKIINFSLNLIVWFILILLLSFFVTQKSNTLNINLVSLLYILFICSYYIVLIAWAGQNNLINDDFTLEISWERHLGTLILGLMIFILVRFYEKYSNNIIICLILIILINVAPANSIRVFLPKNIMLKDNYWNNKYNQRLSLKKLSNEISDEFEDYSNLVLVLENVKDPYFLPILKYELIKINTVDINANNSVHFFNNFNFKKNKLYIMSNKTFENKRLMELFKKLNVLWKSNLSLQKKKSIDSFVFYEIYFSNNNL